MPDPSLDEWKSRFTPIVGATLAAKYAQTFVDHCISIGTELSESRLAELGVKVGHRDAIEDATQLPFTSADLKLSDSVVTNDIRNLDGCGGSMQAAVNELKDGTEWINVEGSAASFTAFQDWVKNRLLSCGGRPLFPASFAAAFAYTKPMPYFASGQTDDCYCFLLVMRTPKLKDIEAGKVAVRKLTDLFVMLIRVDKLTSSAQVVTVHRRSALDMAFVLPVLDDVKSTAIDNWRDLVSRITYEVVCSSKSCLEHVRLRVESLCATRVSHSPSDVVEEFQVRGRQGQTLNRVLAANARVLGRFKEMKKAVVADQLDAVYEEAETLRDLAEELENLSFQSMETRITMLDFRSQNNTKIFTYIAMITQPIGLLTGWYGMNFQPMPEFNDPNGYFWFIAFALALFVTLLGFIIWVSFDFTGATTEEDEDNTLVPVDQAATKTEPTA